MKLQKTENDWRPLPEWYATGTIPFDPEFLEGYDGTELVTHNGSKLCHPALIIDGVWHYNIANPWWRF